MLVAQREALGSWLTSERVTTGGQLETFSSLAVSLSVHITANRVCARSISTWKKLKAGGRGCWGGKAVLREKVEPTGCWEGRAAGLCKEAVVGSCFAAEKERRRMGELRISGNRKITKLSQCQMVGTERR